jgi:beta-glucanase (GH16 family)
MHIMRMIRRLWAFLFLACLSPVALAQSWQLVWQDEFNGSIGPDWVFETGNGANGWGNNELQYYRRENATVENGNLVITARRQDYGGFRYTSARMKTQGKRSFKYGRIEARIAMPSSLGLWPAFWMLGSNITQVGWPASGEIDVMEHVNTESDVHGTVHWQAADGSYASYGGHTNAGGVTGYHVYSVEWDANFIRWFIDGRQYHAINITNGVGGTDEFHKDFFLLLNLAVGGNLPGFNVNEAALPAKMYVDYVRVYQRTAGFSTTVQAESWANMMGVATEACAEGGLNVGWIDANDWIVWDVNLPAAGTYKVEYRVASLNGGGTLQLERAGGTQVYGALAVPRTNGWQTWTTVSHQVSLPAGPQQIAIKALAGGWNLNWLKISR